MKPGFYWYEDVDGRTIVEVVERDNGDLVYLHLGVDNQFSVKDAIKDAFLTPVETPEAIAEQHESTMASLREVEALIVKLTR